MNPVLWTTHHQTPQGREFMPSEDAVFSEVLRPSGHGIPFFGVSHHEKSQKDFFTFREQKVYLVFRLGIEPERRATNVVDQKDGSLKLAQHKKARNPPHEAEEEK
jgi:hypothetical protein